MPVNQRIPITTAFRSGNQVKYLNGWNDDVVLMLSFQLYFQKVDLRFNGSSFVALI